MSCRRILRIAVVICALALPVAMDAQARGQEALGQEAEAAGRFQDAFQAYLSAIQSLPEAAPPADEQRLRERIINVVRKLGQGPAVPGAAKLHLANAEALLDPGQAALELRRAIRIAPWWPDPMLKLAIALGRSGRLDEAQVNLHLYELADPEGYSASIAPERTPAEKPDRTAPAEPALKPVAPAVIYVYFPHANRGVGVHSKLTCDGQHVADMRNGRFLTLTVASGFHSFEFKKKKAAASFEGGVEHYLRIGIEGYPAHWALKVVEPGQAAAEMLKKKLVPNDQKDTVNAGCVVAPARKRSGQE